MDIICILRQGCWRCSIYTLNIIYLTGPSIRLEGRTSPKEAAGPQAGPWGCVSCQHRTFCGSPQVQGEWYTDRL